MVRAFTESVVEGAALEWLEGLQYEILCGPDIAVEEPGAERSDPNYRDVILERRLLQALVQLNPTLPPEALEDAFRKLTRIDAPSLITRNRNLHRMLVDGVNVEYARPDESIAGAQVQVLDFENPENNDWVAVNQFTVAEGQHTRRPDVVIFVNGLPLIVIELKNPADENATIWTAFNQLQTYKHEIPNLFVYNALIIVSDGMEARWGLYRRMPSASCPGEPSRAKNLPRLRCRSFRWSSRDCLRSAAFSTSSDSSLSLRTMGVPR